MNNFLLQHEHTNEYVVYKTPKDILANARGQRKIYLKGMWYKVIQAINILT